MAQRCRILGTVALLIIGYGNAAARVASPTLKELAKGSDVIVLSRVEGVRPEGDGFGATSRVLEVWKGEPGKTVSFVASPTFECDLSTAAVGDLGILFLKRPESGPHLSIASYGRGRMVVQDDPPLIATAYAVLLPDELGGQRERGSGLSHVRVDAVRDYVKRILDRASSHAPGGRGR